MSQARRPAGGVSAPSAQPDAVLRALEHVASLSSGDRLDPSLRVTLNFHPDRLVTGRGILEAMAADGVYRSQFETGTSNGGLTAHPGGDRWRWESRLFAGAYDDADASLRPKYGALNRHRHPVGGAPRFGSAHLRLAAHTLTRTTFCFPDSFLEPQHFGVAERCRLIELADGVDGVDIGAEGGDGEEVTRSTDPLDDYVEAHVHGVLHLATDVEAIVLDPCYRETGVARQAELTGIPVEWHDGYVLALDELRAHPEYRGPEFVALGEQLARDGVVTPLIIGDAARSGHHREQDLKRVWHYVARFGLTAPG